MLLIIMKICHKNQDFNLQIQIIGHIAETTITKNCSKVVQMTVSLSANKTIGANRLNFVTQISTQINNTVL